MAKSGCQSDDVDRNPAPLLLRITVRHPRSHQCRAQQRRLTHPTSDPCLPAHAHRSSPHRGDDQPPEWLTPAQRSLLDRGPSAPRVLRLETAGAVARRVSLFPTSPLNASLFKYFPIYERLKLELRLEAIKVTNHPYFGSPGTNMSNP